METKILGIFAHLDDESFAAGGILAANPGADLLFTTDSNADGKASVRRREFDKARAVLGVSGSQELGLPDGSLSLRDVSVIEGKIYDALATGKYTRVVGFGADGFTGHPDHVVTAIATSLAVQRMGHDIDHWQVMMPQNLREGIGEYFIPIPKVNVYDSGVRHITLDGNVYDSKLRAVAAYESQLTHESMQRFHKTLQMGGNVEYYKTNY